MLNGKIYLDNFSKDNVDIRIVENENWRENVLNNNRGRQRINEILPEPYKTIVFMMWGDSPTVVDENI